jgi:hypothetical protein
MYDSENISSFCELIENYKKTLIRKIFFVTWFLVSDPVHLSTELLYRIGSLLNASAATPLFLCNGEPEGSTVKTGGPTRSWVHSQPCRTLFRLHT